MERGDLSNRLPPRWLVVFEGVIATHPTPADQAAYDVYRKLRSHKRALHTYVADEHVRKVLWDLTWRRDYKFDVVTFLPEKIAAHVAAWLDQHNVPAVNTYIYDHPHDLAKELVYMPDVHAVVHAEEENRFTYGHRGVLVSEGWE